MYSEDITKAMASGGIAVGDTVSVKGGNISVEGELMPKTEAGNDGTLIIKLKSGYNIGIVFGEGVSISRVSARSAPAAFPFTKPKANTRLPNVTVLWTGGTIGSKIDYRTGGVYMTVKPEELLYYVPELSGIANISINHLFGTSSEDLTHLEWQKIAEETAKAINGGARGVVITHGTDTMHYTASALGFMLKNLNAPVVLTGSQRSSDRGSSDAFLNLTCAMHLAAKSDVAEVGICMHASSSDDRLSFIRGVKARKMHTSRRDAFRPINDRPLAMVRHNGDISYTNQYRRVAQGRSPEVEVSGKFEPKVALIKAYPGSEPGVIDYYTGKGYRGIIIEGTGLGHTPVSIEHEGRSWLPYIKRAVDGGAVVGMTSQCLYGRVHRNVYKNLRLLSNAGVVYCEDMLPETAYVKLGWLLGNYSGDRAAELLCRNVAGEINERVSIDEFLD